MGDHDSENDNLDFYADLENQMALAAGAARGSSRASRALASADNSGVELPGVGAMIDDSDESQEIPPSAENLRGNPRRSKRKRKRPDRRSPSPDATIRVRRNGKSMEAEFETPLRFDEAYKNLIGSGIAKIVDNAREDSSDSSSSDESTSGDPSNYGQHDSETLARRLREIDVNLDDDQVREFVNEMLNDTSESENPEAQQLLAMINAQSVESSSDNEHSNQRSHRRREELTPYVGLDELPTEDDIGPRTMKAIEMAGMTMDEFLGTVCPLCYKGSVQGQKDIKEINDVMQLINLGIGVMDSSTLSFLVARQWNENVYKKQRGRNQHMMPLRRDMAYSHIEEPHCPDGRIEHFKLIKMNFQLAQMIHHKIFVRDAADRMMLKLKEVKALENIVKLWLLLRKQDPNKFCFTNNSVQYGFSAGGSMHAMNLLQSASSGSIQSRPTKRRRR